MSENEQTKVATTGGDLADLGDLVNDAVAAFNAAGKDWYKSRGCWGPIVAGLSALAGLVGFFISPEDQLMIITLCSALGTVIGSVLGFYGRLKAKAPITSSKAAASGGKAAAAVLLLGLGLGLLATPAWAGDGGGAGGLVSMSLFAYALNLAYAMGGFLFAMFFWFWAVDKLVLKGFDTRAEVGKGNLAVAQFAGLSFVGMCLLLGLSMG